MTSTGDRQHLREVTALAVLIAATGWLVVFFFTSGAIGSSLPPCGSGNYLAGTCEPDETGIH